MCSAPLRHLICVGISILPCPYDRCCHCCRVIAAVNQVRKTRGTPRAPPCSFVPSGLSPSRAPSHHVVRVEVGVVIIRHNRCCLSNWVKPRVRRVRHHVRCRRRYHQGRVWARSAPPRRFIALTSIPLRLAAIVDSIVVTVAVAVVAVSPSPCHPRRRVALSLSP